MLGPAGTFARNIKKGWEILQNRQNHIPQNQGGMGNWSEEAVSPPPQIQQRWKIVQMRRFHILFARKKAKIRVDKRHFS